MIVGLFGMPSSGKSTFFKSLTLAEVEIAPYPFTTLKPNIGIGYVKTKCVDREFNKQCNPKYGWCKKGYRFIPVKIMDVPGLIEGAHEGKGLGNEFLNELMKSDVLINIVDITKERPWEDVQIVIEEVIKWIISLLEKKKKKEEIINTFSGLKIKPDLVKKIIEKTGIKDKEKIAKEVFKLGKPMIIAANKIDKLNSLKKIEEFKKKLENRYEIIPCTAKYETILKYASNKGFISYIPGEKEFIILKKLNKEQKEILKEIKLFLDKFKSTGVQEILDKAVFNLGRRIVVYPVANVNSLCDKEGNILPDAFLMEKGSTLEDLAKKVHSEIADNLIGGIDARTKKRLSKNYILKNGDVISLLYKK